MRCTQRRRGYRRRKEDTISILALRPARRNWPAHRGGEHIWPEFFWIFRLVALADNLSVQAPAARKEDAGRSRLDTGSVFRERFRMRYCQTSSEHDSIERP